MKFRMVFYSFCYYFEFNVVATVHVVVRSLMKLYNPHALDLTIANAWVRSSS